MENTLLVRGARQLLTLRGPPGPRRGPALRELGIVPDGALLIRGGMIREVGSSRRVENLAAARHAQEINAVGRVVMPGFVDSHALVAAPPSRLDEYERWIDGAARDEEPTGAIGVVRTTSTRRLERRAAGLVAGLARHGTTTFEAKSGYGLDRTGELKMLRVAASLRGKPLDVISTYFGARAVPREFTGDPERYLAWICSEVLPLVRRRGLASFIEASCEPHAFKLDQARRYLQFGRGLGFGLKVHADQFSRTGAARLAVELEAVTANHLDCINEADVQLLATSSTVAVLTPGATFHLGSDRYAPARALIDAGAAVALASGFNPEHSPTFNMQMVLSLACLHLKMTPAEAICAATVNAAEAVRHGELAGSFAPGKQADLVLLNVADYREIPYYFGVNHVHRTLKRGVTVYHDGGTGQ